MNHPSPVITEAAFQAQVLQYAAVRGWTHRYHTHDSRRSTPGFPDLVLVRPAREGYSGEIVFAELKREAGKPTPAQLSWLQTIGSVFGARAFLWKPSDWSEIEEVLR